MAGKQNRIHPRCHQSLRLNRENLDPGSKQASLSVNANTNAIFRRRLTANGISVQNGFKGTNYLQGTNYVWLRLMRMGSTFVAHTSTNGLNWQYLWFTSINMSNQVQVGLAVTAHHYGQLTTATFDNVTTGGLTPLSGVWPLSGPAFLPGGEKWSPAEIQRLCAQIRRNWDKRTLDKRSGNDRVWTVPECRVAEL